MKIEPSKGLEAHIGCWNMNIILIHQKEKQSVGNFQKIVKLLTMVLHFPSKPEIAKLLKRDFFNRKILNLI